MLFIGQKLSVPKQEETVTTVVKEDAVDRSLDMVQNLSNAFKGQETTKSTAKKEATNKKETKEKKTTKQTSESTTKESKEYQVSATRKKDKRNL